MSHIVSGVVRTSKGILTTRCNIGIISVCERYGTAGRERSSMVKVESKHFRDSENVHQELKRQIKVHQANKGKINQVQR